MFYFFCAVKWSLLDIIYSVKAEHAVSVADMEGRFFFFFVNVDFDVLGQGLGLYTPQRDKGPPACVEEQILQ